ncbi:MAG: APC family permease [Calditrichaeota bacterium]|nr:MAG: APC family permease [Calditrichota bacterium]
MASQTLLKSGALGTVGVAVMGAVMMSPALGIYGNFGPMALAAGRTTPLVFLAALIATLPTAICYAMISREIPSSGSAYTWLWETVNPAVGIWIGWLLGGFFVIVVFLQPLLFGLFFNDLMRMWGFDAGYGMFVAGFLLGTGITAFFSYRGIEFSEKGSAVGLIFQMVLVAALAVTIIVVLVGQGELDLSPFLPSSSPTGMSGIAQALVFGLLSFVGFNVITNLAEETRNPRKSIPIAVVAACVIVGLYWVVISWAYVISMPIEDIIESVNGDVIPVVPIARQYWGVGQLLVIITGMIAALGVYIATVIGASRVLYAMARDGSLPKVFCQLNSKRNTPNNALHVIFALTLLFALLPAGILGIYNTYIWWGAAVVFFALITYIFVCIANPVFYLRFLKQKFSYWWNGIIPLLAFAINAYLLYKAFFVEYWRGDWATGKSVVLFALVWMILGLVYLAMLRKRTPGLFKKQAVYLREK